jgi:hypothetical protein
MLEVSCLGTKESCVRQNALKEWVELCCVRHIMWRGLKYAVVVGTILLAINHGDAVLSGELTADRWVRMALTAVVPYWVSVFSSAGALRAQRRSSPRE